MMTFDCRLQKITDLVFSAGLR